MSNANDRLTPLTGTLPPLVKANRSPYIVTSNVEVPLNTTVTIEPGTIFLFKNFSGLHVLGTLVAEGTSQNPIIFTSELDGEYNPEHELIANPFDWDGIRVYNSAVTTSLKHCWIQYSVYSLLSETKFIQLNPVYFKQNGKKEITIGEQKVPTSDSKKFTHTYSPQEIPVLEDPYATRRNLLRGSGMALLLGGVGYGIYQILEWQDAQSEIDRLSSDSDANLAIVGQSEKYQKNIDKRKQSRIMTISSLGVAVLGGVGFTVSFTF